MEIKDFYVNNNFLSIDSVDGDDELKISFTSKTAKNYKELLSNYMKFKVMHEALGKIMFDEYCEKHPDVFKDVT